MAHRETHRILVVDDEPEVVGLVRDYLRKGPYEILEAGNGEEGLRLARERQPDLILLDVRMPGDDGIAVVRQLKTDPATLSIPIIHFTSVRDKETTVEAFRAGADDYVPKSADGEEVEARIRTQLRKRKFYLDMQSRMDELSSSNEQLEQLLMVDEKTRLFNFRTFQRRLREEWQRAERYKNSLSLIFFDLDHFKEVNDRLGHQAGDRVLSEFAVLVTGGKRAPDLAARYGGEEFAIILPQTDGPEAVLVAERVRNAVRQFVFIEDETPTRITVSAGVATHPSRPEINSPDTLVGAADAALYVAKESGRDQVVPDEGIVLA